MSRLTEAPGRPAYHRFGRRPCPIDRPRTEEQATFDRQVYHFPSAKEKEMFEANPAKYVPALGGDCVVCKVNMGATMPGKAEFAVVHEKRAYLFPSAAEREAFDADPAKFAPPAKGR